MHMVDGSRTAWIVGGVGALLVAAGCSSSNSSSGSTSDDGGTAASSGTSSGTSSNGGTASGGAGAGCAPTSTCQVADTSCLGLSDNTGKTMFGLRMAELDLTAPAALARGAVAQSVQGDVTQSDVTCNLDGTGTSSWLLQFDTGAGTLKTGGAKPVADPAQGYAFDDEMLASGSTMLQVQPVTFSGVTPDASGNFSTSAGQNLVIPFFLDASGTSAVVLPIDQLTFTMATLSASNNCIGTYNAAGLDVGNNCQPDDTHPQFVTGGSLSGYISLKDADSVVIAELNETLCVLLSGDPTTYGMMAAASDLTTCKTDAGGNITFQGDWCSTTNMAASGGCADAVQFAGKFAASSVSITN